MTFVLGRRPIRRSLLTLGALFAITGATGLVAEQVFEKLLGTLLGTSTPAAAVVLAVYFAGLSLGAASYAPWIRLRAGNPLRAYALLEAGVALWALVLNVGASPLIGVFAPFLSLGVDHFAVLQALRLVVACFWILPPTFMMGATFPAVVDALERMRVPSRGRMMAAFYGLNIAGAIAGACLAPYLLFPRLGMGGTLGIVTVADGAVAAACLVLSGGALARRLARRSPASAAQPAAGPADRRLNVLTAVAAGSGFLFFSLEVTWIHLIGAVLGNSVYSFAIMLAVVLAGLGLGAAAAAWLLPRERALTAIGPVVLIVLGALALCVSHDRWPSVPGLFSVWGAGLTQFSQGELLRWIQAVVQLLPAATLLGMVYPLLFRLDVFPREDQSAAAGRLGAASAIGCVAGALATGFLLIPRLGSEATHLLIAVLYLLCACGLLMLVRSRPRRIAAGTAATLLLVLAGTRPPWDQLALTSGEHVYFGRSHVQPDSRLLFFDEDTAGGITTVTARRSPHGIEKTLLTNGKFQGNDSLEAHAQTGFALIPTLLSPAFEKALVIGLGTGQSAHVVAAAGFAHVDVAEIAPGIVDAAKRHFGHLNHDVLNRPNVRLRLEDGRNLLLLRPDLYDLVTMEISSVWFAGSTNLYSREFYELVQRRLRPNGVFQQWIQLHHIGATELVSVVTTLRAVFPRVSLWVYGGQGILVATNGEQRIQPAALARIAAARDALGWPAGELPSRTQALLASRLLAPDDVTRLASASRAPLNTDRNRFLEYATPRYNLVRENLHRANVLLLLRFATFPPFSLAAGNVDDELARAVAAVGRAEALRSLGSIEPIGGAPRAH